MFDSKIVKQSLTFSVLAVAYVAMVVTLMDNAEKIFGPEEPPIAAPMAFLLLFVVSAATMGMLIFGKPVMLYIDGKRREAVAMVVCTIASLALCVALLLAGVMLSRS